MTSYQVECIYFKADSPCDDGHDDVGEVANGLNDAQRVLLVLAVVDGERDGLKSLSIFITCFPRYSL